MPTPLRRFFVLLPLRIFFVLYLVVYLLTVVAPSHAEQLTEFFHKSEFADRLVNENKITLGFVKKLDSLRKACDFPFIVNSGYRSSKHPIEIVKPIPGTHTKGIAADIRVTNAKQRRCIVEEAIKLGFKGIGVHKNFVHIDMRKGPAVLWVY